MSGFKKWSDCVDWDTESNEHMIHVKCTSCV